MEDTENSLDPRGELICDGALGIPIQRDQVALCLVSGGIDSPVAAYRVMGRGCYVKGIHFLNSTNDTAAVVEKNRRIASSLSLIQGTFQISFVDISKLQSQIVANVPNQNRTLVYKWIMLAVAAAFDDSCFIVVGDSIGQVASQTAHNISTLYSTVPKAVIAPLAGAHKTEVMDTARKINTYDHSIVKADDCCQYMMCKIGANLFIGQRALRAAVAKIKICELAVTTELFVQGQLTKVSEWTVTPSLSFRSNEGIAFSRGISSGAKGHVGDAEADGEDSVDHANGERIVYFDAAAGTVVDEHVQVQILASPHGNPSSLHASGRASKMAIEKVRAQIAAYLHVPASDIIFTSGGTEANNIALRGFSKIEREAWSHASTAENPFTLTGDRGLVKVIDLVNHETGSIAQNIRRPANGWLHVDACQAIKKIDLGKHLDISQVDSISISAHKFNGPVGIGAVYIRDLQNTMRPIMFGGAQEFGMRPGTENVPGIVGLGAALRINRDHTVARAVELLLRAGLEELGCVVNFRGETSGYIVHATIPEGFKNVDVVTLMSTKYNIEIGTGSACKTGQVNIGVYETLGIIPAPINRSIRLSYDHQVTVDDAEYLLASLKKILTRFKK